MTNNDVHSSPVSRNIVWEVVGDQVVILNTTTHTTHRLDGPLANAFIAHASGQPISTQQVTILTEAGLLAPQPPLSRRALITGGVAGVGVGLTSLALPLAAAASSSGTPLTPTITAASLVAGEWRWSPEPSGIDITQRQGSVLLPTTGVFVAGERWRLTLADLNGAPAQAEADVASVGNGLLQLTFPFPSAIAADITTDLQGTLTKVNDPTVFSEQFPIPRV